MCLNLVQVFVRDCSGICGHICVFNSCVQRAARELHRNGFKYLSVYGANARNTGMIQSVNFSLPCQTESPAIAVTTGRR